MKIKFCNECGLELIRKQLIFIEKKVVIKACPTNTCEHEGSRHDFKPPKWYQLDGMSRCHCGSKSMLTDNL